MGRKFVGIAGAVALGLTLMVGATGTLGSAPAQHSVATEHGPSVAPPAPPAL